MTSLGQDRVLFTFSGAVFCWFEILALPNPDSSLVTLLKKSPGCMCMLYELVRAEPCRKLWFPFPCNLVSLYYNHLGFVCLLKPQIFCQCYKSPLKTLRLKGILSVILTLKKSVQEPADLPHGNRLVSEGTTVIFLAVAEGTTVIFLAVAVLGILFTHFGFMFCIACKSLSSRLFMYILFPVLPYEAQYFSRFLKEV